MPRFKVRRFNGADNPAADVLEVDARDEHGAAELACGVSLIEGGKPGQLRAQVWPAHNPGARKMFYITARAPD